MANVYKMIERNQAAHWLAVQYALRIGGLMGIGMLGAVRKSLDTYLVCLQHGADYARQATITDSPEKFVASYADAMTECVEKSWQDFRNNLQIWLLTQDEALIWIARIDKALLAAE
jgi:hypothetical protein